MPIRFRCPNCQQLMGIARRKAGQAVRCPTCDRDVRVPTESSKPAAAHVPAAPAAAAGSPLFDRPDFDVLLHAPPTGPASGPALLPPRIPPAAAGGADPALCPKPVPNVEPVQLREPEVPKAGWVLSSRQITVGAALVVIVVASAFAAGVVVGRYLL